MGEHKAAEAIYAAVAAVVDEINGMPRETKVDYQSSYDDDDTGYRVTIIVTPIGGVTSDKKQNENADIMFLLNYWRKAFLEVLDIPYGATFSMKDRQCMKTVYSGVHGDIVLAKRMIDFFLRRHASIPGFKGTPSIPALAGFRIQILGALKKTKIRQKGDAVEL